MIRMLRHGTGITSTIASVFLLNDMNTITNSNTNTNTNADMHADMHADMNADTNASTDSIVGIYYSIFNKFGSDRICFWLWIQQLCHDIATTKKEKFIIM